MRVGEYYMEIMCYTKINDIIVLTYFHQEEDALFVAQIIALYLNSDDTSFALCKWFYTKEEAEYKPLKVPVVRDPFILKVF